MEPIKVVVQRNVVQLSEKCHSCPSKFSPPLLHLPELPQIGSSSDSNSECDLHIKRLKNNTVNKYTIT